MPAHGDWSEIDGSADVELYHRLVDERDRKRQAVGPRLAVVMARSPGLCAERVAPLAKAKRTGRFAGERRSFPQNAGLDSRTVAR